MKFIITGRGIEVTEAIRAQIEKKMGKLDRFFEKDTEAHVTLSSQKTRQIVEITIRQSDMIFRAEHASENLYDCIDSIEEIVERQVRKHKTRLERKVKDGAFHKENFSVKEDVAEETDFNLVRTKKYPVEQMTVDDAILQMNLLEHEFYIFLNESNEKEINVVYKRKTGGYGLIIPEYR
jgi:putative sigma-54 modulation protein